MPFYFHHDKKIFSSREKYFFIVMLFYFHRDEKIGASNAKIF